MLIRTPTANPHPPPHPPPRPREPFPQIGPMRPIPPIPRPARKTALRLTADPVTLAPTQPRPTRHGPRPPQPHPTHASLRSRRPKYLAYVHARHFGSTVPCVSILSRILRRQYGLSATCATVLSGDFDSRTNSAFNSLVALPLSLDRERPGEGRIRTAPHAPQRPPSSTPTQSASPGPSPPPLRPNPPPPGPPTTSREPLTASSSSLPLDFPKRQPNITRTRPPENRSPPGASESISVRKRPDERGAPTPRARRIRRRGDHDHAQIGENQ